MSEPTELTVAITLLRQRIGAELVADIIAKIRTALDEALAEGERRGREAAFREAAAAAKGVNKSLANTFMAYAYATAVPIAVADKEPDTITSLDVLARIARETTGEGE